MIKLPKIFFIMFCLYFVFSTSGHARPEQNGKPSDSGKPNKSVGNKIIASPEDYILQETITLSDKTIITKGTQWYVLPDVEKLRRELDRGVYSGDKEWAEQVVFGHDIMANTFNTIGEGRTDGLPPLYQKEIMACESCHAQAGTVPYAWPLFRTYNFFGLRDELDPDNTVGVGKTYGNLGYARDVITRIRDCGVHCAGNGQILEDSIEMDALEKWTKAVAFGIYPGEGLIQEFREPASGNDLKKIPGARIPLFDNVLSNPETSADPVVGQALYDKTCASCHGQSGLGKWNRKNGYSVPPLAGDAAVTYAGGPATVPVLAAFIKKQMPLSNPGSLTEQQALDISAYISTMERTDRWWQEYFFEHNPCGRPAFMSLHVGVVPIGFPFSADQVKFGPWSEIHAWLKNGECSAIPENQVFTTTLLSKDFDNGFDPVLNDFVKPVDTPDVRNRKVCVAVEPQKVFDRIEEIVDPILSCDSYNGQYFEYIVRNGDGVPEIGLSLEDNFDGTWNSAYFDYINPASDLLIDEHHLEKIQECRRAFEPPFKCP